MRRFWKLYLGLYCGLIALGFYWLAQSPGAVAHAPWDEKLAYITAPLGALGLFGYAYRRRLLWRWVWVVLFVVALSNQLLFGLYQIAADWSTVRDALAIHPDGALLTLGALLVLLPYFAGLFLYAFRESLWRDTAG